MNRLFARSFFQGLRPLAWFALATSQAFGAAFVPDDPYFEPNAPGTSAGYFGEWQLQNQMPITGNNAGLDANLAGAWALGLTGNGVVIGIVDNGLQGSHPDLSANFQNLLSWDFEKTIPQNLLDSFRGSPTNASDNHGTGVGGVAAAVGGNGIGVTGAAPFAGLSSLKDSAAVDADNLDAAMAYRLGLAIRYQGGDDPANPTNWAPLNIQVKNHSYGYAKGYYQPAFMGNYTSALIDSTALGVINVISAGNFRPNPIPSAASAFATEDTNKTLANTLPASIQVAALGSNGTFSYYSSYGASVFVTAPSNSSSGQFNIATTDRTSTPGFNNASSGTDPYFSADLNYTSIFGGSSASAPLVSGIMALGIEANSAMNLRMAQHLLARTSRVVDATDSSATCGWVTNAAGFHFNNNYGFGLIDAGNFTTLATQVASVSALETYSGSTQTVATSFTTLTPTLSEVYNLSSNSTTPLEYVRVHLVVSGLQTNYSDYLSGNGTIAGDLAGWLTSPNGTRNALFSDDRNLIGGAEVNRDSEIPILDWTFLSYAYWGEEISGNWLLEIENNTANTPTGTWDSFSLDAGMGSLSLVPEPSATIALALLGFAGMLARSRRRKNPGLASKDSASGPAGINPLISP